MSEETARYSGAILSKVPRPEQPLRFAGQTRGYEQANPTRDRSFWNCAFDLIPSQL